MTDTLDLADTLKELISDRKYADIRKILDDCQPADIAQLEDELNRNEFTMLFRLLPKEPAAEVFVEMDPDKQKQLIDSFSDAELKEVFDELYFDDTVDIIEEMPANVVSRILKNASPATRKTVNELLKYPEDSAGAVMTTEYVLLKENLTVDGALQYIRKTALDKETIYTCYVTDINRHLIGLITAKTLLISPADARIGDIMDTNIVSMTTTDDKEEVARTLSKYDFLALPVVDGENRLVGIVTVDDAIDVLSDEAEEDFAKMAAITPTEKPYLKTSVFETWLSRIPWLLLLMVSATFTGMIITGFESALAAQVALTAFIPMLMDTGGNSGSQASVTIIRGLSLGEIDFADILRVIWKEVRVAVLCGLSLAIVSFGKIMLIDNIILGADVSTTVAIVVCLTLVVTVLCAKIVGCTLPIFAKKLGLDPAVMASPFITTIVDAVSLVIYFAMASALLNI